MAGTTVDTGLADFSRDVENIRKSATKITDSYGAMIASLSGLPTKYAAARNEVNAYTEPNSAVEEVRLAKLAEYTTAFGALRTALSAIKAVMDAESEI